MILWMSRKFRIARDAEDSVEEFLQSFNEASNQPCPEQQAAQAKMQMDQQTKAQELQIKQAETQAEIQRKNAESQAAIERDHRKAALEEEKLQLEIAERQQKIRLMREEAEAKVVLKAVEQMSNESAPQPASSQDSGGKTPDITINTGESVVKPDQIELIRGADSSIKGANALVDGEIVHTITISEEEAA